MSQNIAHNILSIRKKISGRDTTLICVTKNQSIEKIQEAVKAGEKHFGANYSQELLAQSSQVAGVHWHFIGHLQRNKVKQILPFVELIHSVDSLELAQEINKRAVDLGKIQSILLEVNLGNEASKTGMTPEALFQMIPSLDDLASIQLKGLMCIPPFSENPEDVRPYFRQLREIRDVIHQKNLYKNPLTELSMGMSHDYEIALQEGATMIRIGTGIFGERHAT